MLPINWLEYQKLVYVNVEITQNFYNAYSTKKYVFVEIDFDSWDPKIHSPRNYLQSFYVAALVEEYMTKEHYPLAMFRNGISKKTISSYKFTVYNGTPLLSSDYGMIFRKKIAVPRLNEN